LFFFQAIVTKLPANTGTEIRHRSGNLGKNCMWPNDITCGWEVGETISIDFPDMAFGTWECRSFFTRLVDVKFFIFNSDKFDPGQKKK
jgi:hypothetical protein